MLLQTLKDEVLVELYRNRHKQRDEGHQIGLYQYRSTDAIERAQSIEDVFHALRTQEYWKFDRICMILLRILNIPYSEVVELGDAFATNPPAYWIGEND